MDTIKVHARIHRSPSGPNAAATPRTGASWGMDVFSIDRYDGRRTFRGIAAVIDGV
jgi:hypothetical protein